MMRNQGPSEDGPSEDGPSEDGELVVVRERWIQQS